MADNVATLGLDFTSAKAESKIDSFIKKFDVMREKCGSAQQALDSLFGGRFHSRVSNATRMMGKFNRSIAATGNLSIKGKGALSALPEAINSMNGKMSIGANASSGISGLVNQMNKVPPAANKVTQSVALANQEFIKAPPALRNFNSSLAMTEQRALGVADGLFRAFGPLAVLNYLKNATAHSIDFGTQIAYITTLANEFDQSKLSSGLMNFDSLLGRASKNANALYYSYSSGVRGSEKELAGFTKTMSELALTIRAGVVPTVDAATSAMNAYALSAKNATELSDLFFSIVKYGKASGSQLATGLGQAIPTAAALRLSLDEMGASISSLTKVQKTRIAITGFNNMLNKMLKPTKESILATKEYGIELGITAVRAKGFSAIMQEIHDKVGDNAEALARIFPDIRGQRAALHLLGNGWHDFQQQLTNFENKAGSAAAAMAVLRNDVNVQLGAIPTTLNKIGQQTGTLVTEILTLGGALTPVIASFNSMDDSTQKMLGAITLATGGTLLLHSAFALIHALRAKMLANATAQNMVLVQEATLRAKASLETAAQTVQEERLAIAIEKRNLVQMKSANGALQEIAALKATNTELTASMNVRRSELALNSQLNSVRGIEAFQKEALAIATQKHAVAQLKLNHLRAQEAGMTEGAAVATAKYIREESLAISVKEKALAVKMKSAGISEAEKVANMQVAAALDKVAIARNNEAISSLQANNEGLKTIALKEQEIKSRSDILKVQAMELNQRRSGLASVSASAQADVIAAAAKNKKTGLAAASAAALNIETKSQLGNTAATAKGTAAEMASSLVSKKDTAAKLAQTTSLLARANARALDASNALAEAEASGTAAAATQAAEKIRIAENRAIALGNKQLLLQNQLLKEQAGLKIANARTGVAAAAANATSNAVSTGSAVANTAVTGSMLALGGKAIWSGIAKSATWLTGILAKAGTAVWGFITGVGGAVTFIVTGALAAVDGIQSFIRTGSFIEGSATLAIMDGIVDWWTGASEKAKELDSNLAKAYETLNKSKAMRGWASRIQQKFNNMWKEDFVVSDMDQSGKLQHYITNYNKSLLAMQKDAGFQELLKAEKENIDLAKKLSRLQVKNKKDLSAAELKDLEEAEKALKKSDEKIKKLEDLHGHHRSSIQKYGRSMRDTLKAQKKHILLIQSLISAQKYKMMTPEEQLLQDKKNINSNYLKYLEQRRSGNYDAAEKSFKAMVGDYNKIRVAALKKIKENQKIAESIDQMQYDMAIKYASSSSQKIGIMNEKIKELYKKRAEAMKKGDISAETKFFKEEMAIRQQKLALQNRLADAERRANASTLKMILSMDKFKASTAAMVSASSVNAVRLQSRRFDKIPTFNPLNTQQQREQQGIAELQKIMKDFVAKTKEALKISNEKAKADKSKYDNTFKSIAKETNIRLDKINIGVGKLVDAVKKKKSAKIESVNGGW